MKSPSHPVPAVLLLVAILSSVSLPVEAQRRTRSGPASRQAAPRRTAAPPSKPATLGNRDASPPATSSADAAPEKGPVVETERVFEALVAHDTFALYSEIRSFSRLMRSEEMTELLGPLGKLAGGFPADVDQLLRFVRENSEALSDAMLVFAAMPARTGVPNALTALKLPTVEEARRFEPRLKKYLATLPAWVTAEAPPAGVTVSAGRPSGRAARRAPASSRFIIKRHGNLLFASEKPFALRSLKAEDATPLADDVRFQQARARLSSEQFFLYVNVGLLSKSTMLLNEQREAQMRAAREKENDPQVNVSEANRSGVVVGLPGSGVSVVLPGGGGAMSPPVSREGEINTSDPSLFPADERLARLGNDEASEAERDAQLEAEVVLEALKKEKESGEAQTEDDLAEVGGTKAGADPFGMLSQVFFGSMFGGGMQWPEAVGVGVGLNGRDFTVRTLLLDEAGKQSPLIPFLPILARGPAVVSEAAAIAPADTELFVAVSLDVPRMYEQIVERASEMQNLAAQSRAGRNSDAGEKPPTMAARIAAIEEKHKFKVKEDFLATLGNEMALCTSLANLGITTFGRSRASEDKSAQDFVALIALKDKEAFKTMLPKVADALGVKLLFDMAKTEKQNDIEIVTIANFGYAYINNYLVFSTSSAAVRRVAENYAGGKTLAAGEGFRDPTAWQPREKLAQVFVARSMMENLIGSAKKQIAQGEPEDASALASLVFDPAAITYAVSDDGAGLLHELRLPKSLLKLMAVMATVEVKQAPIKSKESMAIDGLSWIVAAQNHYKKDKGRGSYAASLDDLRQAGLLRDDIFQNQDYKFEMNVSGSKLEAIATPMQYGTSGRRSFFVDESGTIRGADHKGARATVADEEVN